MKETVDVIGREELLTLIPHKGKMFLLNRVTYWNMEERTLRSEYDVTEDCIFYNAELDGIPSWAAFEFMAQSVSALSGLISRELGQKPRLGFILSVSNMEINMPVIRGGATAVTEIREGCQVEKVFVFNCEVYSGAVSAVRARVTVAETDDPKALLNAGNRSSAAESPMNRIRL